MMDHLSALIGVFETAGEIGGFLFLCVCIYAVIEKAVERRQPKGRLISMEEVGPRPAKLYVVNQPHNHRDAG